MMVKKIDLIKKYVMNCKGKSHNRKPNPNYIINAPVKMEG